MNLSITSDTKEPFLYAIRWHGSARDYEQAHTNLMQKYSCGKRIWSQMFSASICKSCHFSLMVCCLPYSSTLNTEATSSSETSTEIQCVATQTLVPFTATVVRTANPTLYFFFDIGFMIGLREAKRGSCCIKNVLSRFASYVSNRQ